MSELNFTKSFINTYNRATEIARSMKHSALSDLHLFSAALENINNPLASFISTMGINVADIGREVREELNKIPEIGNPPADLGADQLLAKHLNSSQDYARQLGDKFISLETYLLAVVADTSSANRMLKILRKSTRDGEATFNEKKIRETIQFLRQGRTVDSQDDNAMSDEVKSLLTDITELAEQGKLDPVIGRHEEINRAVQILQRRSKNNPIIVGKPGIGKTAIVEGLAQLIVRGQVPDTLKNARIYALDIGSLFAGTQYRGQLEEKIKNLIETIKQDPNIILFIDEIHLIVSGNSNNPVDIANLLKPALSRGELHCIGATTNDEYRMYIEKDVALARRFQKIQLDEPTVEDTINILRGLKERYSNHHRVQITDSAIVSAAILSNRYITDRTLPDKAIDLIDEAASKISMEISSEPEVMVRLKNEINELKVSELALKKEVESEDARDSKDAQASLDKVQAQIADLEKEYKSYEEVLTAEKARLQGSTALKEKIEKLKFEAERALQDGNYARASEIQYKELPELEGQLHQVELDPNKDEFTLIRTRVTEKEITEIISQQTGIPLQKLQQTEREKLINLEQEIAKQVIGQEEAIRVVSDAVRRSHAHIQDDKKPLGSFLFLGTTGVGKTETAKALAYQLFDDDEAIIRIDMSEYMEKHSVSRLIGAPPGYVGYEQGGVLTEAVRRRPYSIVLFDEIEKAHPEVFNIFLQILDNGSLTDSQGHVVNFRNTVIIMTSNIGSREIMENADKPAHEIRDIAMHILRGQLKPEILNRIDDVVVFHPLAREHMESIANIQINRLNKRLAFQNLKLKVTEKAMDVICELGFHPEFGARPMKRVITQYIENPLAKLILAGEAPEESTIVVDRNEAYHEEADILNGVSPLTFSVEHE